MRTNLGITMPSSLVAEEMGQVRDLAFTNSMTSVFFDSDVLFREFGGIGCGYGEPGYNLLENLREFAKVWFEKLKLKSSRSSLAVNMELMIERIDVFWPYSLDSSYIIFRLLINFDTFSSNRISFNSDRILLFFGRLR